MAKSTHAAGTQSDAPTSSQLAELHRQIGTGQVTKGRLQEFLRGSPAFVEKSRPSVTTATPRPLNLNEAMKIVGQKNFFGPNQWFKRFGKIFSIPAAPPIPWSISELESLSGEHFLFLSVDTLAQSPLNLVSLHMFLNSAGHPKLADNWYLTQEFAKIRIKTQWNLMPIDSVHVELLDEPGQKSGYEYANAVTRIVANVLYFLNKKVYLDQNAWALCSDITNGGSEVRVRGLINDGISIYRPSGVPRSRFGLALTRKQ